MEELLVTSPAFLEGGWIPQRHTGRGADISPELRLENLAGGAHSLAVTLEDLDLLGGFSHWVIWNLPARAVVPEGIPRGGVVAGLGATQGRAYGWHRYAGPKTPLRMTHRYRFTVYVLDCPLTLSEKSGKRALLRAMEGHILQKGCLTGRFQSGREKIR